MLAYVAMPYRGKSINAVVENIQRARAVAVDLWRQGYVAVCPHLNSALMDGVVEDDVFIAGDLEILRAVHAAGGRVYFGPYAALSKGCAIEAGMAREIGMRELFRDTDGTFFEKEG